MKEKLLNDSGLDMTEETDLADRYIKAFITNMIHILKDIKENINTIKEEIWD